GEQGPEAALGAGAASQETAGGAVPATQAQERSEEAGAKACERSRLLSAPGSRSMSAPRCPALFRRTFFNVVVVTAEERAGAARPGAGGSRGGPGGRLKTCWWRWKGCASRRGASTTASSSRCRRQGSRPRRARSVTPGRRAPLRERVVRGGRPARRR